MSSFLDKDNGGSASRIKYGIYRPGDCSSFNRHDGVVSLSPITGIVRDWRGISMYELIREEIGI